MGKVDFDKVSEAQRLRAAESAAAWSEARKFVKPSPFAWDIREGEDGIMCIWMFSSKVSVIASASREADGKRWLHVSVCHRDHLPSWELLRQVKDEFIGKDRKAIQVLPAASEYVNINPNVLHLWHCMDGDTLPDFTGGSGSI